MSDNECNKSVFALFQHYYDLECAIDQLKANGFERGSISVVGPDLNSSGSISYDKESKSLKGAAVRAPNWTVLGGTIEWLIGAGALVITGFGPLISAGPLFATLAGISLDGTVGGFTGALIGLGIPEYEAVKYESSLKKGKSLIVVEAKNETQKEMAEKAFKNCLAIDISITSH